MALDPTHVAAGRGLRGRGARLGIPGVLVILAAAGWWWSVRMAGEMSGGASSGMEPMGDVSARSMAGHSVTLAGFAVAWVAMMAAMMFPAISPVVRLYALAAARGRVAPLPFFVAAYLVVWGLVGVPAYVAWRALDEPLADGAASAGRLAAIVLIAAAAWQLTPLKAVCLRHCRSPLSFFMEHGGNARRRLGAFRMGVAHGLFCLGCCWALMAVLVAMGTMSLAWMAVLAGLILLEKNAAWGERVANVGAGAFAVLGTGLLLHPQWISSLT